MRYEDAIIIKTLEELWGVYSEGNEYVLHIYEKLNFPLSDEMKEWKETKNES